MEEVKYPLFAARLTALREAASIASRSELGRLMGTSVQATQKWEAGHTIPAPGRRKRLAKVLGITVQELVTGTELEQYFDYDKNKVLRPGPDDRLKNSSQNYPGIRNPPVPLISWTTAARWGLPMENIRTEEAIDWIESPVPHGTNAFVLEVTGESNVDRTQEIYYSPGEYVFVDPSTVPVNRSMVVVRYADRERCELKQLLTDESGTRLLRSLNPEWPDYSPKPMPDSARIVGVVYGKFMRV